MTQTLCILSNDNSVLLVFRNQSLHDNQSRDACSLRSLRIFGMTFHVAYNFLRHQSLCWCMQFLSLMQGSSEKIDSQNIWKWQRCDGMLSLASLWWWWWTRQPRETFCYDTSQLFLDKSYCSLNEEVFSNYQIHCQGQQVFNFSLQNNNILCYKNLQGSQNPKRVLKLLTWLFTFR